MRKFLSLLLVILLLCGITAMPMASAEENYCQKINNAVDDIRWFVGTRTITESQSFPMEIFFQYVGGFLFKDEYGTYFEPEINNYLKYEVPAELFENEAKKRFKNVDVSALRSYKAYTYNPETEENVYAQIYDEAKNKYILDNMGGMGDSTMYVIAGYTNDNGKLTAYLHYGEPYYKDEFPNITEGKTEGVDYIEFDAFVVMIERALKTVVKIVDNAVQFHSWEPLDKVPAVSGLITPATIISTPSSTPAQTSSKTTTTSTQTTTSASTTTSDATASQEATTSETVSSEVSAPLLDIATGNGVLIQAEGDAFPEATAVKVMIYGQNELQEAKADALKKLGEKFVAYEITALKDNVTVQPNGSVVATFDIPKDFDPARVAVVYVDDNGNTEAVKSQLDTAKGQIKAFLSHFSTYAVVEQAEEALVPTIGNTPKKTNVGIIIAIVAAIVVVLGGAFCAWFFLVFKKKKQA